MSDFLTNLAARSFSAESAIRPRVASLFEPVSNGGGWFREGSPAEPIETQVVREVEVESKGERTMSRAAPALRADTELRETRHSAQTNPVSPVMPVAPVNSEQRTAPSAGEKADREDTEVVAKVQSRRMQRSREEDRNDEPAMRSDSGSVPKRVAARAPAAFETPAEFPGKDHRALVLPPKGVADLTTQMKNTALARNDGSSARDRGKAATASDILKTEHEPSVHVTIGRIEVRAISESKQASRPRPSSPVMSLEEYLHRRTQRGGQ